MDKVYLFMFRVDLGIAGEMMSGFGPADVVVKPNC